MIHAIWYTEHDDKIQQKKGVAACFFMGVVGDILLQPKPPQCQVYVKVIPSYVRSQLYVYKSRVNVCKSPDMKL